MLRAEERIRGLEKATKLCVSFRYLGLRVAPTEAGVNAGPVKIDEKCSLRRYRLCGLRAKPAGSGTAVGPLTEAIGPRQPAGL